jgi:hypothetical protein
MTGIENAISPCGLSSDSLRRVSQYQTAGTNARLKVFALLAAQGVTADEADDLVAALEAGAVAGAQSGVVELDGVAPAFRGSVFAAGWDEGVAAVSEALVGIADRGWAQRGGRSVGAAELAVHIADVRQRERVVLERLEAFVRRSVLPNSDPEGPRRRQALEALGEDEGLCTARTHDGDTGEVVICFRPVGHYNPDDEPSFTAPRHPGGWHRCGSRTWRDYPA